MKERSILFSAPMVRALLDGSKSQTRRVMKAPWDVFKGEPIYRCGPDGHGFRADKLPPYGQPGDRLWVRESGVRSVLLGRDKEPGLFRHDVPETLEMGRYWVESTRAAGASYNASACTRQSALLRASAKACPSIHMPRWACRILLEVASVRVERLNDISEADCWAEGIEACDGQLDDMKIIEAAKRMGRCMEDAAPTYAALWESINGAGSWSENPFVWVLTFKRVTP